MLIRPDDQLTSAEIEAEYGVKRELVKQWAHRGKLRPVGRARLRGGPWLYRRHDVERVVAAQRGVGVSP
jgi:predicted site-specific integrase-resolvase